MDDLRDIDTAKVIKRQGNSMVLILTKELSMIGLSPGDKVRVHLERTDEDETISSNM